MFNSSSAGFLGSIINKNYIQIMIVQEEILFELLIKVIGVAIVIQ